MRFAKLIDGAAAITLHTDFAQELGAVLAGATAEVAGAAVRGVRLEIAAAVAARRIAVLGITVATASIAGIARRADPPLAIDLQAVRIAAAARARSVGSARTVIPAIASLLATADEADDALITIGIARAVDVTAALVALAATERGPLWRTDALTPIADLIGAASRIAVSVR